MRKSKHYVVPETGGRDDKKKFLLTEMPATQAEKWAAKAFLALSNTRLEIPVDIVQLGMAGIALIGFQAFRNSSFVDLEPLMDEMFGCVQIVPPSGQPRDLIEEDIEEVKTRLELRKELMELHMGFTFADVASKLTASAKLNSAA